MNTPVFIFMVLNAFCLFALPRSWAPLPLLVGACYMTLGQGVEIGPFNFTVIRILIGVGLLRLLLRGERLAGGFNSMDRWMMIWALWVVISVPLLNNLSGEAESSQEYIFRLGLAYNTCGLYFLLRALCHTIEDVVGLVRMSALLLAPLAVEMLVEMVRGVNLFAAFGGVPPIPDIREGRFRAQGPFAHAILAGTVGAVSLPPLFGLWKLQRSFALIGIVAGLTMVVTCASSGPIMSVLAGAVALWMWRYRERMALVRKLAILSYILLEIFMKAPAYFVLARMDIIGGSTGWHRAALIETAIEHFNEWWLGGTNFTRHWLPTGVSWSPNHTDITNHYLHLGVIGGLPLIIIFFVVLVKGFSFIGQILRDRTDLPPESQFMVWALGSALFVHATTFISVAYFDQSFVLIYLTLGAIGSLYSAIGTQPPGHDFAEGEDAGSLDPSPRTPEDIEEWEVASTTYHVR